MASIMSFFTIEDHVRFLLTKYPYPRDSKNEEIVRMYRFCIFKGGKPSSESITRILRKVKQQFPDKFGPTKLETIQNKQNQTLKILDYVGSA